MADARTPDETAGPTSKTRRRGTVSRARIIATALDFVERGESDAMSMRALASTLEVTPMALYQHVPSKHEILEGVVDALLERIGTPTLDHDWQTWMIEAASQLRHLLVEYPVALGVYTSRPVATPAALRRMEVALGVLRSAGFSASAAADGYATIHTYTIGFAALQASRGNQGSAAQLRARQHYWQLLFASLDPDEFPNLVGLAPDLGRFFSEEQFRAGLERIIDGLGADAAGQKS